MIPIQLQQDEFRFILVKSKSKKPIEADWTVSANYKFDNPKLLNWIANGENFGIACGFGNLVAIDCDQKELVDFVEENLPETFSVVTGSGNRHFFFKMTKPIRKIILKKGSVHYGEIQTQGAQVIGAGSMHPNGKPYEVLNDAPIREMEPTSLFLALQEYIPINIDDNKETIVENTKIPLHLIFNLSALRLSGDKKNYCGKNQLHDCTCPGCLSVNPSKGVWKCFDHDSGGDAFTAIAVKYGIIDCSEAHQGVLGIGDRFTKTKEKAIELGLIQKEETEKEKKEKLGVISYSELMQLPDQLNDWVVEGIIPKNSLIIISGKGGAYKSFTLLHIAKCIVTGESVFGHFKIDTEKRGVLFIDEENSPIQQKKRFLSLGAPANGDYQIYFRSLQGTDLTREKTLEQLTCFIEEHQDVGVIVIDSLTRVSHGIKENDAGEINELLQPLKVLTSRLGVSFIVIHHSRKSLTGKNKDADEEAIDTIRGSSDIVNISDVAFTFTKYKETQGTGFYIDCAKMRAYETPPRMCVDVTTSEGESSSVLTFNYVSDKILEEKEVKRCGIEILRLVKDLGVEFKTSYIVNALGDEKSEPHYNERTINRALKLLVTTNKLIKPKRGFYQFTDGQKSLETDED